MFFCKPLEAEAVRLFVSCRWWDNSRTGCSCSEKDFLFLGPIELLSGGISRYGHFKLVCVGLSISFLSLCLSLSVFCSLASCFSLPHSPFLIISFFLFLFLSHTFYLILCVFLFSSHSLGDFFDFFLSQCIFTPFSISFYSSAFLS